MRRLFLSVGIFLLSTVNSQQSTAASSVSPPQEETFYTPSLEGAESLALPLRQSKNFKCSLLATKESSEARAEMSLLNLCRGATDEDQRSTMQRHWITVLRQTFSSMERRQPLKNTHTPFPRHRIPSPSVIPLTAQGGEQYMHGICNQ